MVPRTKLPAILAHVGDVAKDFHLPIANVFHAGDGNLHPLILFDRRDKQQLERALGAATEILKESVRLGGVVSGEHGIGVEKRDYMDILFTTADLAAMAGLRKSFDPLDLFNPGKVFPARTGCGELAELRQNAISANEITALPSGTWI